MEGQMTLLSVVEVARELRVSPCTIRRKIKARQIPFRQVGKRHFLTDGDLKKYIDSCGFSPAEPSVKEGGNHDGK
jgi:excisionase family DNA binding protein